MNAGSATEKLLLGIEAGGTRTSVILARDNGEVIKRREFGPGNLRVLSDQDLSLRFQQIAFEFPQAGSIGLGMAGLRDPQDEVRVTKILKTLWPGTPYRVSHDLEVALLGADTHPEASASVLVLSGTGSCCYGRNHTGRTAKLGGWGHILGDKGSGYEIALRGLKAAVYYLDRDGTWSRLGERILRALLLNRPGDLIDWVQGARKNEIAALAPEVFAAAAEEDSIALDILEGAAASLAKDALSCVRRLAQAPEKVQFIFAGSVLVKQAQFARQVADLIKEQWPTAFFCVDHDGGVWGAVALARHALEAGDWLTSHKKKQVKASSADIFVPALDQAVQSPTEQRNPRTKLLDQLDSSGAVQLMLSEEKRVIPALLREQAAIVEAVDTISSALQRGGRLFYAGAGTSGRLGVLDASECPPTFRADPEQIQGIIAGGSRALWQAVEGAEDDTLAGAEAVRFRGVRKGDVLLGIAASGRTPFVWGAIHQARSAGAKTMLLCFNPHLNIPKRHKPSVIIAPDLGPEVLTGSTRLKSGTATKLVLNILSTLAMVRLGKVISNLMVDLNPSNVKLRDRAIRILMELTGKPVNDIQAALEQHGWVVKKAWQALSVTANSALLKPSNLQTGPTRSTLQRKPSRR